MVFVSGLMSNSASAAIHSILHQTDARKKLTKVVPGNNVHYNHNLQYSIFPKCLENIIHTSVAHVHMLELNVRVHPGENGSSLFNIAAHICN